ncbi:MAG: hypothetical protein IJK41_10575 [Muribaculaceae bacterium]|nr:hypothetical protein [Muribaculaceae bacterium]
MKKFYMILAAVAAMTLSAQAQEIEGTIEVGDFYNTTEVYDGSYWDCAPTTYYLAHTGAQMIYTANELADLQGKKNVQITKLTFRLQNAGAYEDIYRNVKIYMEASDATEFAVNEEGVKQFFTFDKLVYEGAEEFSMLDFYYEDQMMEYELDEPFSLPADKNLIVTMVYDAEDDDNCIGGGTDMAPFYCTSVRGQGMTYTDNVESFLDFANGNDFPDATATLGCGTNVELPVTVITYTYSKSTSVEEVKAATAESNVYYNLMGQKFTEGNLPAGIYIHNGQKVIVK